MIIDPQAIVLLGLSAYDDDKKQAKGDIHLTGSWKDLDASITKILDENPTKDIFLFGGFVECSESRPEMIDVILAPKGLAPPKFIAVTDFETCTEEVIPFDKFNLTWRRVDDGRVHVLSLTEQGLGGLSEKVLRSFRIAYLWKIDNSQRVVDPINWSYPDPCDPDEDLVLDQFDPQGKKTLDQYVTSFLKSNEDELQPHPESHRDLVKAAIEAPLLASSQLLEGRIDLLRDWSPDCDPSLLSIIRIFSAEAAGLKIAEMLYVSKYYGNAESVLMIQTVGSQTLLVDTESAEASLLDAKLSEIARVESTFAGSDSTFARQESQAFNPFKSVARDAGTVAGDDLDTKPSARKVKKVASNRSCRIPRAAASLDFKPRDLDAKEGTTKKHNRGNTLDDEEPAKHRDRVGMLDAVKPVKKAVLDHDKADEKRDAKKYGFDDKKPVKKRGRDDALDDEGSNATKRGREDALDNEGSNAKKRGRDDALDDEKPDKKRDCDDVLDRDKSARRRDAKKCGIDDKKPVKKRGRDDALDDEGSNATKRGRDDVLDDDKLVKTGGTKTGCLDEVKPVKKRGRDDALADEGSNAKKRGRDDAPHAKGPAKKRGRGYVLDDEKPAKKSRRSARLMSKKVA